jgi:hypothetical protein
VTASCQPPETAQIGVLVIATSLQLMATHHLQYASHS